MASEAEVKLKPWLYTIVRNRALNDLRDEPAHEHLDESFDGVPQPPEVVARRERARGAGRGGSSGLPPAQRDALVQRELEGRSHREIGVALGVSPGAVRGLIFRARTALRDAAGMLIPVPVLRALLNAGPLEAEAAGTAIGGAAAGLTAGGGGGVAAKAGATLAVAVLAVGSGVAIQNRGDSGRDRGATAFASNGSTRERARAQEAREAARDRDRPANPATARAPTLRAGPRGRFRPWLGRFATAPATAPVRASGDDDGDEPRAAEGDADDSGSESSGSREQRLGESSGGHGGSELGKQRLGSSGSGSGGSESSGSGSSGSGSSGSGGSVTAAARPG